MAREYTHKLKDSEHHFSKPASILQKFHIDIWLLILIFILSFGGIFILYSASSGNFNITKAQIFRFLLGFVLMFVMAQFNPKFYQRIAPWIYGFALLLLLSVLFWGVSAKGAQRWLNLFGIFRFQPSELMKLALPMILSAWIAKTGMPLNIKSIFIAILLMFMPIYLVYKEPDLGTAILIFIAGFFTMFLAGLRWIYLIPTGALAGLGAFLSWEFVLKEYQKDRIRTFLSPETDILGTGWNIVQSKTAIGSGGLFGKGFMQGTQTQLDFLPERHTDFILAVLAEEWGLIGVFILIILYSFLLFRCYFITNSAEDTFSRLIAGTITLTFFVYAFVNMGMVSGFLPVVGVPLPLISYGGTSIITLMAAFGILMSISTHKNLIKK